MSYLEGFLQTDYVRHPQKLRAVQQVLKAFQESNQSDEEKLEHIRAGDPTLFFTEWDDHVAVVGFLRNRRLFKGNRGYKAVRVGLGQVEAIRYYQTGQLTRGVLLSVIKHLMEGALPILIGGFLTSSS